MRVRSVFLDLDSAFSRLLSGRRGLKQMNSHAFTCPVGLWLLRLASGRSGKGSRGMDWQPGQGSGRMERLGQGWCGWARPPWKAEGSCGGVMACTAGRVKRGEGCLASAGSDAACEVGLGWTGDGSLGMAGLGRACGARHGWGGQAAARLSWPRHARHGMERAVLEGEPMLGSHGAERPGWWVTGRFGEACGA
jgi:hypothetical protein